MVEPEFTITSFTLFLFYCAPSEVNFSADLPMLCGQQPKTCTPRNFFLARYGSKHAQLRDSTGCKTTEKLPSSSNTHTHSQKGCENFSPAQKASSLPPEWRQQADSPPGRAWREQRSSCTCCRSLAWQTWGGWGSTRTRWGSRATWPSPRSRSRLLWHWSLSSEFPWQYARKGPIWDLRSNEADTFIFKIY